MTSYEDSLQGAKAAGAAFAAAGDAHLSAADRQALDRARRLVPLLDSWYGGLEKTPFAGFRQAYHETGCQEYLNADLKSAACYMPFADGGFSNVIYHGYSILDDAANAFVCDFHESLHAIQFSKAAALHAMHHNRNPGLVLTPRAFMFLYEAIEHDSYAKSSAALFFLRQAGLDLPLTPRRSSMTADEFSEIHDFTNGNVNEALWHCGDDFLRERHLDTTLRGHYRADLLRIYDDIATRYAAAGPVRYVTVGMEDLFQICTAFGPNSRGPQDGFYKAALKPARFSPAETREIRDLHQRHGIPKDRDVPSFGEALKALSLSRGQFLDISRARQPQAAKTLAPGAVPA